MRRLPYSFLLLVLVPLVLDLLCSSPAAAQARTGAITGTVTDTSHAILPGASEAGTG